MCMHKIVHAIHDSGTGYTVAMHIRHAVHCNALEMASNGCSDPAWDRPISSYIRNGSLSTKNLHMNGLKKKKKYTFQIFAKKKYQFT